MSCRLAIPRSACFFVYSGQKNLHMQNISLNFGYAYNYLPKSKLDSEKKAVEDAQTRLHKKTGKGHNFLGWLDLPEIKKDLFEKIKTQTAAIRSQIDTCVVIGIGGSYLGARAVLEALQPVFHHNAADKPLMLYAGHHLCEDFHSELLSFLDKRNYGLIVISKSGTTTEPAIAFRLLKNHLEKKIGKAAAAKRIIAITDKAKGALKELADEEKYSNFVVPDDVGGRFSVLSPVGLVPVSMAGYDIDSLLKGAADIKTLLTNERSANENQALQYALYRNLLYQEGKTTEIMVNYTPRLQFFAEWWKQLFGESEGKEHKGIFPAAVNNTSDLHSMGQYIQEGKRNLFETVLSVKECHTNTRIPEAKKNTDGLNYLAGKNIHYVNQMAELGTSIAHFDGSVPVIQIRIPEISEYFLGQLIFFFEYACAISAYTLDVNPFDQPGVEDYKNNMFALLGKPGFEAAHENIMKRIGK